MIIIDNVSELLSALNDIQNTMLGFVMDEMSLPNTNMELVAALDDASSIISDAEMEIRNVL